MSDRVNPSQNTRPQGRNNSRLGWLGERHRKGEYGKAQKYKRVIRVRIPKRKIIEA